ncbi:MAG TPA: hypothetical protein VJ655_07055 [Caulobacter sp.]|nr:hypothetical protein [Caulobacter sp.]
MSPASLDYDNPNGTSRPLLMRPRPTRASPPPWSGTAACWARGLAGCPWLGLSWRLKGDAAGEAMFVGKDRGLCVLPRWRVDRKDLN